MVAITRELQSGLNWINNLSKFGYIEIEHHQ